MANYAQAAQVLHMVRNSIDIKVQFNPDKYLDKYNHLVERSDSEEESEESEVDEDDEEENRMPPPVPRRSSPQRSGSPTPRNSPKVARGHHGHEEKSPPGPHRSTHSTLTRQQVQHMAAQVSRGPPHPPVPDRDIKPPPSYHESYHDPRLVCPLMKKSTDLGKDDKWIWEFMEFSVLGD